MRDDHAVGFLYGGGDRRPIVRKQAAQIDDLDADALLLGLLCSDERPLDQRAVSDYGKVLSLPHSLRFTKRDHEIVLRILRLVVGLAIEMLVLKKQHGIVTANRRAQQAVGVKRA